MSAPKVALLTGPLGEPERIIQLERPMTVAEVIAAHDLQFRLPTIAVMGGEPVLRKCWHVRMVPAGEVLAFIAIPGGGGSSSSGSGKQIIGLVATIALAIAAPVVGGLVAGALGFASGTAAFSLVSGVVSLAFIAGGTLLLNALMPKPPKPKEENTTVYSANAAANMADPLGVVPALYGRLRFAPRFASRPYSEFVDNEQYLYQLFHISEGKAPLERIEFGDTTAWTSANGFTNTFSDLTIEITYPGDEIKLFPANVVTSSEVSGQQVPQPPGILGPFTVNASGSKIEKIAVDFAFPGGLFGTNKKKGKTISHSINLQAEYREINDLGDPVGNWANVFHQTFTYATKVPQRITRSVTVPPGRYEVRFKSNSGFSNDPNSGISDQAVWVSLRGYLTDFVTPPGCTLLAMRIRASEQLSQASSQQINVTATRWLPVFDGTIWSAPQPTQSIAWAAADILRNTEYALALSDVQYDLPKLFALDQVWAARGDKFNAIFDRKWTGIDALSAVLRAGRTQPVRIGGTISFVRDEPRLLKRMTFTPRNVRRGSFNHKIILFDEENPDHVIAKYLDETVWQEREVKCFIDSVGLADPERTEAFGITDHNQVWREGVFEAAINAYRREFVGFETEFEGKLLVRGDPILIHHPFIEGIFGAAVAGFNGHTITTDRDMPTPAGDAYVILRDKQGKEWGPCLVESMPDARTIVLDVPDFNQVQADMGALPGLLPDERSEPAHLILCDGETRPFNALVVSATPHGNKVEILAVNDAPEVHLVDGTQTVPSPWFPPPLPPAIPSVPIIQNLYVSLQVITVGVEAYAIWAPSPGAQSYVAEVSYDQGASWGGLYAGTKPGFTQPVLPQPMIIRVAAIGSVKGPWVEYELTEADIPDVLFGVPLPDGYVDFQAIAQSVKDQFWPVVPIQYAILEQLKDVVESYEQDNKVQVQFGSLSASFETKLSLQVSATQALAQQLSVLQASVGNDIQGAISNLQIAMADADQALADSIQQVSATVNGQGVTISQQSQAIANVNGKLTGFWAVTLDNDGHISGLKLYDDGTVSAFIVTADKVLVNALEEFTINTGSLNISGDLNCGNKIFIRPGNNNPRIEIWD